MLWASSIMTTTVRSALYSSIRNSRRATLLSSTRWNVGWPNAPRISRRNGAGVSGEGSVTWPATICGSARQLLIMNCESVVLPVPMSPMSRNSPCRSSTAYWILVAAISCSRVA